MRFAYLWLTLGWLLVAAVVWLSLTPAPPEVPGAFDGSDKVGHWLAYFALAAWFVQLYGAWGSRLAHGLLFIFLAIGLEFVQEWGGVRAFEVNDMIAGALGVFSGLALGMTPAADTLKAIDQRLA